MVLFDEVLSQPFHPDKFVRLPFDVAEKIAPTRSESVWQDLDARLWIETTGLITMFPTALRKLGREDAPQKMYLVQSMDEALLRHRQNPSFNIVTAFDPPSCLDATFYAFTKFKVSEEIELQLRSFYGSYLFSNYLPCYRFGNQNYRFAAKNDVEAAKEMLERDMELRAIIAKRRVETGFKAFMRSKYD